MITKYLLQRSSLLSCLKFHLLLCDLSLLSSAVVNRELGEQLRTFLTADQLIVVALHQQTELGLLLLVVLSLGFALLLSLASGEFRFFALFAASALVFCECESSSVLQMPAHCSSPLQHWVSSRLEQFVLLCLDFVDDPNYEPWFWFIFFAIVTTTGV